MAMPTLYQLQQFKLYLTIAFTAILVLFISGNLITYFFFKKVTVNSESYELVRGFPFFTSEEDYISFIENYPYDAGTDLTIYTASSSDTIWRIRSRYNISIETLISANPHLRSLNIKPGQKIVIPSDEGTLFPFTRVSDIRRMKRIIGEEHSLQGSYKTGIFRIISPDDMRLLFFKNAIPAIVNPEIELLYRYKLAFLSPLNEGVFTSMFGDRINPFSHAGGTEFHNGIDIAVRPGTPIRSAREGMVFFSGWRDGYGNTVIIQHHDGYMTMYAHCLKLLVQRGDWVEKGDIISTVGSTGRSTGPHLHYTLMRHGTAINPLRFIW